MLTSFRSSVLTQVVRYNRVIANGYNVPPYVRPALHISQWKIDC